MDWFHIFVGEMKHPISWWQMSIRAVLLFGIAVAMIRIGGDRIFGKNTVLDIVLGVVLGSNISRALTGNAPFWATVIATVVLVALHALLAHLSLHSDLLTRAVKGNPRKLVEDGQLLRKAMRREGIGEDDLIEAMRVHGHDPDLDQIKQAYLERSGTISIVTKSC